MPSYKINLEGDTVLVDDDGDDILSGALKVNVRKGRIEQDDKMEREVVKFAKRKIKTLTKHEKRLSKHEMDSTEHQRVSQQLKAAKERMKEKKKESRPVVIPPFEAHRRAQRDVGIRLAVNFLAINDVENTFMAEFNFYGSYAMHEDHGLDSEDPEIHFDREKTEADKSVFVHLDHDTGKPRWRPHISLHDANSEQRLPSEYTYAIKADRILVHKKVIVTFREGTEMRRFPFDRQIFSIAFSSGNCRFTKFQNFSVPPEFPILPVTVTTQIGNWELVSVSKVVLSANREIGVVLVHTQRRFGYYFTNICSIIYLLVLIGFTVPGLGQAQYVERQGISVTLVLATVAFKYVIQERMPAISHLTYLDMYVLSAFAILFLQVMENFGVAIYMDQEANAAFAKSTAQQIDLYWGAIGAAVWTLMHIVIVIGAWRGWFYENWVNVREKDNRTNTQIVANSSAP